MEHGGNGGANGNHVHGTGPELRVMRNIAASECGAKLLQASPSAKHAPAILVDNNDEYMNQPCASEKWYVLSIALGDDKQFKKRRLSLLNLRTGV